MWLRSHIPLYVPQSFLLPFFFQIGTSTARCQSSGTFLFFQAFWNIVVGHVIQVSPHASLAWVVISSNPATLFLGLVFTAFLTSDFRIVGSSWSGCLGMNWYWMFLGPVGFRSLLKYSYHLCLMMFSLFRGFHLCHLSLLLGCTYGLSVSWLWRPYNILWVSVCIVRSVPHRTSSMLIHWQPSLLSCYVVLQFCIWSVPHRTPSMMIICQPSLLSCYVVLQFCIWCSPTPDLFSPTPCTISSSLWRLLSLFRSNKLPVVSALFLFSRCRLLLWGIQLACSWGKTMFLLQPVMCCSHPSCSRWLLSPLPVGYLPLEFTQVYLFFRHFHLGCWCSSIWRSIAYDDWTMVRVQTSVENGICICNVSSVSHPCQDEVYLGWCVEIIQFVPCLCLTGSVYIENACDPQSILCTDSK